MTDNTNTSIANDYRQCTFTNSMVRYFGTFIFVFGILSSLLSICVFATKPLRRKSCCFYFLVLSISDSMHLLTVIIEHLPHSFNIDLIIIHTVVCKLAIFFIYFSNHFSNLVLTLASVDRFILIHCPSHAIHYCSIRKGKLFVLIGAVVVFLANAHILYGYEKISIGNNQTSPTYDCNIRETNVRYKRFFQFYDSYIESIVLILIPFSVMLMCSVLIIYQIFRSRKSIRYNRRGRYYYYTSYSREPTVQPWRKSAQEHRRVTFRDKDIQLCWMLIGTTFAFIILCLPTEVNDIFNYNGLEYSCAGWFRKVLLMLVQQIYYAGHFYIYTLTGALFRKQLYSIFFNWHSRRAATQLEESLSPATNFVNRSDQCKSQCKAERSNVNSELTRSNQNIKNSNL